MLNTETGEMTVKVLGKERQWRMTSREAKWLESVVEKKKGTFVPILNHLAEVGSWGIADLELACAAGLRFYDMDIQPDDISLELGELIEFRLDFLQFVASMVPPELKKKVAQFTEAMSQRIGNSESN